MERTAGKQKCKYVKAGECMVSTSTTEFGRFWTAFPAAEFGRFWTAFPAAEFGRFWTAFPYDRIWGAF
ncbi:hypothetical protein AC579_5376 [Pseudocercospora musae]|uniref:Uncharacterized protein n=1 Tax=Pseudocercospora musae TaxID=113226 RepID=A0A139H404_9PEZI|nr:hypothetical protein AC579_5376 [Pseudocercospora musae]